MVSVDVCLKPSCWDSRLTNLLGLRVSTCCARRIFSAVLSANKSLLSITESVCSNFSLTSKLLIFVDLLCSQIPLETDATPKNTAGLIIHVRTKHTLISCVRYFVYSCLHNFLLEASLTGNHFESVKCPITANSLVLVKLSVNADIWNYRVTDEPFNTQKRTCVVKLSYKHS